MPPAAPEEPAKGFSMESRVSAASQADPSRTMEAQEKRLLNSCQEFASVLVSYMMHAMDAGSSGDDQTGLASGIYHDMFSQQVAKVVAHSNTLGLGEELYARLSHALKTRDSQPGAAPLAKKAL